VRIRPEEGTSEITNDSVGIAVSGFCRKKKRIGVYIQCGNDFRVSQGL
jgi:hypothetical protein